MLIHNDNILKMTQISTLFFCGFFTLKLMSSTGDTATTPQQQPSTVNVWGTAAARERCWKAWSAFFNCSEDMPPLEARKKCKVEKTAFFNECPKSWVEHFLESRATNSEYKPPKLNEIKCCIKPPDCFVS